MESMNFLSTALGTGVSGAIVVSIFIVYQCCKGRNSKCRSGCIDVEVSKDNPSTPKPEVKTEVV